MMYCSSLGFLSPYDGSQQAFCHPIDGFKPSALRNLNKLENSDKPSDQKPNTQTAATAKECARCAQKITGNHTRAPKVRCVVTCSKTLSYH